MHLRKPSVSGSQVWAMVIAVIIAGGQAMAQQAADPSPAQQLPDAPRASQSQQKVSERTGVSIGGEPIITLQRAPVTDRSKPQFLQAIFLPGRGMAVLQIKALLPGKGEIDVLNAPPVRGSGAVIGQD